MSAEKRLPDHCLSHLERALDAEDPSEKDYHIRTVLQAYGVEDLPEDLETELTA